MHGELFDRLLSIITLVKEGKLSLAALMLHETIEMAAREGVKGEQAAFGNLFAQVTFLCKKHSLDPVDIVAIQNARRETATANRQTDRDLMYHARAVAVFISKVFGCSMPEAVVKAVPPTYRPADRKHHIDYKYIRCVVKDFDDATITAHADFADGEREITIDYTDGHFSYLRQILRTDMQLNALDSELRTDGTIAPRLIIVEPDFLIDISRIAALFTDYGTSPLGYTVNRMKPAANTEPILLGGFAGSALDDIVHTPEGEPYSWADTLKRDFQEHALEYTACQFDAGKYKESARNQARNIERIVKYLFRKDSAKSDLFARERNVYDRDKAVLEPSFVCERLGLQGRVDLMTTDLRLLVEQKSGKNFNIERGRPGEHGSIQKEDHYVQLLLYYGVLHYNFDTAINLTDEHLLYSKYPLPGGLVNVNFYQGLFIDAINLRNRIVAGELFMAREGFDQIIDSIKPSALVKPTPLKQDFINTYILPQLNEVCAPLHSLSALERAYLCRMLTFVYREQMSAKIGAAVGQGTCDADVWNMPLAEKREAGNIYTELKLAKYEKSDSENGGYDLLTLELLPTDDEADFLPNFRRGDMVVLYAYEKGCEPDIRHALLYKGTLVEINVNDMTMHLNNGQRNPDVFSQLPRAKAGAEVRFAIEHSSSDASASAAIRSMHQFICAEQSFRDLLLAQRKPEADTNAQLTRQYHKNYDEVVLKAKQAKDYFLLVGPPGTGKTSMALHFLVEEALADGKSILLMAYTNRAVDEISEMLVEGGIDFMRIGNIYSAEERYRKYFIEECLAGITKLSDIKARLLSQRVFVGTTSSMQGKSYLLDIKRFDVAIIDEASQILEPNIVGLLAMLHTDGSKFILIGDHKQLPAVVQQDVTLSAVSDECLVDICLNDCRNSLFERLIRIERRKGREQFYGVLNHQGRMHPDIAHFSSVNFYEREGIMPVPCPHQLETTLSYAAEAEDQLDRQLKNHRMLFVDSSDGKRDATLSDKVNPREAEIVADILRRIYRFYGDAFDPQRTVGVIIPYRNQIAMIRKEIERLAIPQLKGVSIDTIERYQGSQRDVIIYSFTVSRRYQLDFLTNNTFNDDGTIVDRKLNVALTRARKQMIITGNAKLLSQNPTFKKLIDELS